MLLGRRTGEMNQFAVPQSIGAQALRGFPMNVEDLLYDAWR